MLAVSFFSVVGEYMRLLLFICLPVLLSGTALAVWLHYRQKRRRKLNELANPSSEISLTIPDASQLIAVSPLATEDKFNLVKECKKQLARSRAKFMALKHDLAIAANRFSKQGNSENYNSHMENLVGKINAYELQVEELQHKVEVLQAAFPNLNSSENLQTVLDEKNIELLRVSKMLEERNQQVKDLENLLSEAKQQYNLLNPHVSDKLHLSKEEVLV